MLQNFEIGFISENYNTSTLENGEDEVFEDEKMIITLTTTQNQRHNANIINVIRYHHELESCPKEVWKLSALIHFADLLAHYPEGTVDMAQFDLEALKMFNIKSEEQIVQLSDRFRNMFRNGAH